jgi:hypothetical protein
MSTNATREQLIDFVLTPLNSLRGDPTSQSATKSTKRLHWDVLHDWDIEHDTLEYWAGVSIEEKRARLSVPVNHWETTFNALRLYLQNGDYDDETDVRKPVESIIFVSHNAVVEIAASDPHARIANSAARVLGGPPLSKPDSYLIHENRLVGFIEVKPWWKLTVDHILQVKEGILFLSRSDFFRSYFS